VIYVSTLSKIMFPSARVGFIALPEELYKPLSRQRAIVTRQNNIFTQDAIARWMETGGFERHLKRMRRIYQERRDAIIGALEAGKRRGLALDWCPPDGGMALWLDCGVDSELVAARAAERGVFVASEPEFWPGSPSGGTHIRLGYASQTPEEIGTGMELLMDAVAAAQRGRQRKAG
jgi:GntR family transcriptional regulator/MocR family aminotransferase